MDQLRFGQRTFPSVPRSAVIDNKGSLTIITKRNDEEYPPREPGTRIIPLSITSAWSMGVLESRCPTCRKLLTIVYQDRSLETLLVERTCDCPAVAMPRVVSD